MPTHDFYAVVEHYGLDKTQIHQNLSSLGIHVWNSPEIGISLTCGHNTLPMLSVAFLEQGKYRLFGQALQEITPSEFRQLVDSVSNGSYTFVTREDRQGLAINLDHREYFIPQSN